MPSLDLMLIMLLAYVGMLGILWRRLSDLEDRLSDEPRDATGFREWGDEDFEEDEYADKR
jgi:hypothetical protein